MDRCHCHKPFWVSSSYSKCFFNMASCQCRVQRGLYRFNVFIKPPLTLDKVTMGVRKLGWTKFSVLSFEDWHANFFFFFIKTRIPPTGSSEKYATINYEAGLQVTKFSLENSLYLTSIFFCEICLLTGALRESAAVGLRNFTCQPFLGYLMSKSALGVTEKEQYDTEV